MNKHLLQILAFVCILGFAYAAQPWDFLRPLSELAGSINFWTKFLVFALSIAIFIISLKAYLKTKTAKFLFVGAAFFLFSVKWAIKIADLFLSPGYFFSEASENIVELLIFLMLFLAIFKK